jgi:hypothetical protein
LGKAGPVLAARGELALGAGAAVVGLSARRTGERRLSWEARLTRQALRPLAGRLLQEAAALAAEPVAQKLATRAAAG